MNVIGHEVGLLDGGIAGQARGRILRIEYRHRTAPGFTGRQLDPAILHAHIAAGVRHEESVATDADRQRHIVLLADRESRQCEVEHVLLILGVEHDHAAVQQIRDFDIVRLNGERRIDHTAREHGNDRKTVAGPRGDAFQSTQRARTRGRGIATDARAGSAGDGRHDADFFFTPIIFFHIAFAIQHTDKLHRFGLRSDRIRDSQIHVRTADRLFRCLAAGDELFGPWRFEEHIFRRHNFLPLRIGVGIFLRRAGWSRYAGDRIALWIGLNFGFAHGCTSWLVRALPPGLYPSRFICSAE